MGKIGIGLTIIGVIVFAFSGYRNWQSFLGLGIGIIGIVCFIIGIVKWIIGLVTGGSTSSGSYSGSSSSPSTSSNTAMDYNNRGSQNAMNGNFPAAISNYTEAMKLGLNDAQIYCSRGNCFYKVGNLTQAIQDWEKALSINPSLQEARSNLQAVKS